MVELFLLGVSIFLVLACGLFVAAEFSLIAVNRTTVDKLASSGDVRAIGVAKALRTLSTQLSSAQVGITITNLIIGFLAEPAIAHYLQSPLEAVGVPTSLIPGIALTLGIGLATVFTMIFGELIPKNLAIARPLATAKFIQKPLLLFTWSMSHPIRTLNNSANFILKKFGIEPQEELASARSADELLSLVKRSAETGTLPKETALMLERSLNFGELTALDVMTPRVRIQAVHQDAPVAEVLRLAKSTGLSRFPVYGKNLDNVVGLTHIKHIFRIPRRDREKVPIKSVMVSPVLVPSTIELESLMEALRLGGLQMAVVIDEFGGTDGLVTIEDLLEELVGEVHDEHDRSRSSFIKKGKGSWELSGLLRPDKIGEELGLFLPDEDEVETLGGLLIHEFEKIPKVGDVVSVNAVDRDGEIVRLALTVVRMDNNRIDRVKMSTIRSHHRIMKGDS